MRRTDTRRAWPHKTCLERIVVTEEMWIDLIVAGIDEIAVEWFGLMWVAAVVAAFGLILRGC